MNNLEKTLRDLCHVAKGYDGDRFVSIKTDTDSAEIYFPIGWNLPDDDRTIREDIITLFRILYAFIEHSHRLRDGEFLGSLLIPKGYAK